MNTTNHDLPDAIRATAALLRRAETSRCNASAEAPPLLSPLECESLLHMIEVAAERLAAPAPREAAGPLADCGIAWWNGLSPEERTHWLRVAGSACPADAFEAWRAL